MLGIEIAWPEGKQNKWLAGKIKKIMGGKMKMKIKKNQINK